MIHLIKKLLVFPTSDNFVESIILWIYSVKFHCSVLIYSQYLVDIENLIVSFIACLMYKQRIIILGK